MDKFIKILNGAATAFLSPWVDKGRAQILLAGILGSFCYGAQSFALNFELGGQDLQTSLTFQILRFSLLGFIGIPATFWLMTKEKALQKLLLVQGLGALLFFIDTTSGVINAFAFAISCSPFFAIYNYNFALKQTDVNRNNESALSNYVLLVSGCLGLFVGGWLLENDYFLAAVFLGSIGGIAATAIMYSPLPDKNYVKRTRVRLGWRKPSNRVTFMTSMNGVLIDSCLPIWMNVIGISAMSAGINMALRPLLGLLIMPLFGFLMKRGVYQTSQYISAFLGIGWLFMAAAYFWPIFLPLGLMVLMAATNLMAPMEMNRWFKRRSVSATIAREGIFAAGRLPTYLVGIPVIFAAPFLFPFLGFSIGALFTYGLIHRKPHWGDRFKFWRRPVFVAEALSKNNEAQAHAVLSDPRTPF